MTEYKRTFEYAKNNPNLIEEDRQILLDAQKFVKDKSGEVKGA